MGVTIETLTPGNGKDFPKPGDRIKTHYVGTLIDGTQFDSSRDRGVPFETQIGVGRVIKGWDEGILKLSVGEKARLTITPDFGYKDLGHPGAETRIPANATLIFEVELLSIVVPT